MFKRFFVLALPFMLLVSSSSYGMQHNEIPATQAPILQAIHQLITSAGHQLDETYYESLDAQQRALTIDLYAFMQSNPDSYVPLVPGRTTTFKSLPPVLQTFFKPFIAEWGGFRHVCPEMVSFWRMIKKCCRSQKGD